MAKRVNQRRPPLSAAAGRDLIAVLKRSLSEFGPDAAARYNDLIMQAIRDVATEPNRLGSKDQTHALSAGVRSYHIELSKDRVPGEKVRNPRHILLYRPLENGVEILRILHDSRILSRAIPAKYRTP